MNLTPVQATTGYVLRDEFEKWVKNPHMLNRRTEPGYTDEYEHLWTCGAWAAWKEMAERAKPQATEPVRISADQWDSAINGLGTQGRRHD